MCQLCALLHQRRAHVLSPALLVRLLDCARWRAWLNDWLARRQGFGAGARGFGAATGKRGEQR